MTIQLDAVVAEKIGFVSQQNAVPILHQLSLHNQCGEPLDQLTLTFSSSPNFIRTKIWNIDRLDGDEERLLSDTKIDLNTDYLFNLTESIRGTVSLCLKQDEKVLAECQFNIELLAKNEWGGGAMCELLPAFVTPNDPAIDKLLKAACDVLHRAGKNDSLNGYSEQSRRRTWELASALWSAVADLKLSYALPPASFEQQGQKIRTPSAILESRLATCLDSTLLFAAALEQMHLNPVLVLLKEHAFVGVWLQPQEFNTLIIDEPSALRKRLELQEIIFFETTLITQQPTPRFKQAIENAKVQLQDDEVFRLAIDVKRARMQQIKALAVQNVQPFVPFTDDTVSITHLDEAPDLPAFDVEERDDEESGEIVDQLILWQKKLLNLTTRNRLLHFSDKSKGIRLICPDPAKLEDRLANGKGVKFTVLPEMETSGRDADLYSQQNHQDWALQYAMLALEKGEVVSKLEKNRLDAKLVELYLDAKRDLEEGGANTLYLALGFLKWKKSPQDTQSYQAPLILLPVKFERRSFAHISMKIGDDEPRFNLTLLELLRHDFGLTIPSLEEKLPCDDAGIDVELVWRTVQLAVKDMPGFEVTKEIAVGIFSFAKYFMWKDMVDQREQLLQNPLVRHLIERKKGQSNFDAGEKFISAQTLDKTIKAQDLFIPLPADSSQIAAIVASASGKTFVLDGPPGTGKSQTIANMIAHNLAKGRRVLFVAEKKAALDVVYRRLEEKGLGAFCIELHSNKTNKKDFLNQLERAWNSKEEFSQTQWQIEAGRLQTLREKLNRLVGVLHKPWDNGFTIYQAMGKVVRDADELTPKFQWQDGTIHNADEMEKMRDAARRLGLNSNTANRYRDELRAVYQTEWSNGWQSAVVSAAENYLEQHNKIKHAIQSLQQTLQLPESLQNFAQWAELADILPACYGVDCRFVFTPIAAKLFEDVQKAITELKAVETLLPQLSLTYPLEYLDSLNVADLEQKWQQAGQKFWFFATLAKNKLSKQLAAKAQSAQSADIEADLPLFKTIQQHFAQIREYQSQLSQIPHWQHIHTDTDAFVKTVALGKRLRDTINRLAGSAEELSRLRTALSRQIVDGNDLLMPEGNLVQQANKVSAQYQNYCESEAVFLPLLGDDQNSDLYQAAQSVVQNAPALHEWCGWCRVRDEAQQLGLSALVEAVSRNEYAESEAVDLFDTGYARWFAAWAIDQEPLLTRFRPAEHQSDIEAYRRQDDKLSALSVKYIRVKLSGNLPDKNEITKKSEFGILKHELQKQRAHKAIRQLSSEISQIMPMLAPCMLMSPLSVAQYLPLNHQPFDLVIFDEASQITPWDAIGAIARGHQAVIAGDDKQMPPTNFFNRSDNGGDDDTEADMESILSECLAAGVPQYRLNWHYRSRHESLINFSNHTYYDSSLITFPSSETKASAVEWRKVSGVYAKGKQINQIEAQAMVDEVVKRLTDPRFTVHKNSIGIITLNSNQQRLVSDLLDKARQQYPEIDPYFSDDCIEPVIVKNLESIQGDERDVIILGIGFAPTEAGGNTMSMNFGPLNREGGHRRLNVAVTRARKEMMVFTSFEPYMIDLNRTNARAVRELKTFIEFAQKGERALVEINRGSVGGYDSPFEAAVAEGLRRKGWQVVPQIGVSRFRIDLGIVHPERPGDYLVGVECDGATYHSAATARDRDKVRAAILERLGWKLLRVWSTEWWINKENALNELDQQIRNLLEKSKLENASSLQEITSSETKSPASVEVNEVIPSCESQQIANPPKAQLMPRDRNYYQVSDLSTFNADSNRFDDESYTPTLKAMIQKVVEIEAPISENLLIGRIRKAHGFGRAGNHIRERIAVCLSDGYFIQKDKMGERIIWQTLEQAKQFTGFRLPENEKEKRTFEEIPLIELRHAMLLVTEGDKMVEVSRMFGFKRITAKMRERLEACISHTNN